MSYVAENRSWVTVGALALGAFVGSVMMTVGTVRVMNGQETSLFVSPSAVATRPGMELGATHVMNKGAKKMAANRPKKHRPSDRNRKPTEYPTWEEPASDYTVVAAAATRKP